MKNNFMYMVSEKLHTKLMINSENQIFLKKISAVFHNCVKSCSKKTDYFLPIWRR